MERLPIVLAETNPVFLIKRGFIPLYIMWIYVSIMLQKMTFGTPLGKKTKQKINKHTYDSSYVTFYWCAHLMVPILVLKCSTLFHYNLQT